MDNSGEPQLVSEANPVPVRVPTPLAITSTTPLVVNDGGLVIESRGNYTFVFPNEVKLPFMNEKVQSLEVTVTQIAGKWVDRLVPGHNGRRDTAAGHVSVQHGTALGDRTAPLTRDYATFRSFVSRPISTHSATKMLPS